MWKLSGSDKALTLFSALLSVCAIIILVIIDWRIAVAVFLFQWGHNVYESVRSRNWL
jgi:type IV secretory pathway TrbD component